MFTSLSSTKHASSSRLRLRRRQAALRHASCGRTVLRYRPGFEWMEGRALLSTFLVSTTADSGPGSLRQAILDSNAATGVSNTITFNIPGGGVRTIEASSPLPTITTRTLLDGASQPGF